MKNATASTWPKVPPTLSDEQRRIREDWLHHFHVHLSEEHPRIVRFNHEYSARSAGSGHTLEIGAGIGGHLRYEDLTAQRYVAVELLQVMADGIIRSFPSVSTVVADCQEHLPYEDASFDRAIAIHVLEHLPNLPGALDEIERLLRPGGLFSVVIPCEGGLGYSLGRQLTSKRAFERRYKTSYDWFIESEHVNRADEILNELRRRFEISDESYFPARIPWIDVNLLVGITCARRATS